MSDDAELTTIMGRLRSGHDMLPFLAGLHSAGQMQLQPMPADMQALLEATPDYRSPDPGEGPVWLQIASSDDAAELVVYRTRGTGTLYVVAPDRQPS
ncbi:MAG: hypothetical protein DI537_36010 [Stutzerimonas stutzeri]|nr:MAG: hypothetical protein DI537_36010 [Stutzerimonas stutzeri]